MAVIIYTGQDITGDVEIHQLYHLQRQLEVLQGVVVRAKLFDNSLKPLPLTLEVVQ
jgi:hypothetical protein